MKKWLVLAGMLACGQALAIDIDLTNSGAQVQAKDTVRLRNVNVTGYGNYYVDFKWDAEKMMMVAVRADKDALSQFAATAKRYTASSGTNSTLPDFNQACVQEFGAQYQQADWQDIKSAVGADTSALQSFKNTVSTVSGTYYYVKYGGQPTSSSGLMNLLYSNSSSAGNVADSIQGDLVIAQKSGTALSAQIICVKTGNTSPFVK